MAKPQKNKPKVGFVGFKSNDFFRGNNNFTPKSPAVVQRVPRVTQHKG